MGKKLERSNKIVHSTLLDFLRADSWQVNHFFKRRSQYSFIAICRCLYRILIIRWKCVFNIVYNFKCCQLLISEFSEILYFCCVIKCLHKFHMRDFLAVESRLSKSLVQSCRAVNTQLHV